MLTSFKGNNDGAENSALTDKIMGALGPMIAENWPKIEPYADKALAAAEDDATVETLARKIYPWLPMMLRMALKEDTFVSFSLQHKGPLLAKLAEYKAQHASK